jgi:hyperpolarization activated cyclic nucleotide-gated potassium channel 1
MARIATEENEDLLDKHRRPLHTSTSERLETEASPYKHQHRWKSAVLRIKLQKMLFNFKDDILVYGTTNDVLRLQDIEQVIERRETKARALLDYELPWFIIAPTNPLKLTWSVLMILLLVYTATIMPYRIAFEEQVFFDGFTIFEVTLDFFFLIDCFLNIFSAYYKPNGELEARFNKVSLSYLKFWFWIDLVGSFPFSLVMYANEGQNSSDGRANGFVRVMRLPRLYKITSVFRLAKVSRIYKGNSFFEMLKEYFTKSTRLFRLFKLILIMLIVVHFSGCFWFIAARLDDFPYDCWVVQGGFANDSTGSLYLTSFYWAFTTMTTVGYGDIHAYNNTEMIMCIFIMVVGIAFYSMVVSSITSIMSSLDDAKLSLSEKLISVTAFGKETGLHKKTLYKMRQVIKYNSNKKNYIDNNEIFEELPKDLKFEIASAMHKGIAAKMAFLTGKDRNFVVRVMTLLRPTRLDNDEILYKEGSFADEFYTILNGRINLVILEHDFVYKTFLRGSYIGEYEIIRNIPRQCTMQAGTEIELLVMSKSDFLSLLAAFPAEAADITKISEERQHRCIKSKNDAKALLLSKELQVREASKEEQELEAMLKTKK